MRPSEWLDQNRGNLVRRPKGNTVYTIRAIQQGHRVKVSVEKQNGDIVNIAYSDVKKMIPVEAS